MSDDAYLEDLERRSGCFDEDEEDEACPECGRMPAEGCAPWCPENVDADEDDLEDEDLEDEP